MTSKTVSTFCRICEPMCGILATVEDGRITDVKANKDHVLSQGHFCKKARAMIEITYDPDRVLYPLKRTGGPGEFERISWDQAYKEIAAKLKQIRGTHGTDAVATYMGNPPYYSYAAMLGLGMFKQAMDIRWSYCVNGEDGNAIMAACGLLYGGVGVQPKPDYWRTDFLIIDGSNPLASHGSPLCEPRVGTALKEIRARGGRVVVVDPRQTETAREFEHVGINAGTDAYFLSAMIHEIIKHDLVDSDFIARRTRNFDALKQAVATYTPEWATGHCGIPAEVIRQLALDFARAKSATFHTRLGTSSQRFGTLSTMLAHVLCAITGNLDKPGGLVFGFGLIDLGKVLGAAPSGTKPSRVDKLPDVAGDLPATALINDIEVPGEGQVRAMIMLGANPCLNAAASGERLDHALQKLELFVSTDLYVNDTNQFAHYVLPSAAFYEREDVPFLSMGLMIRPSMYATRAVIEKQGEAKEDWQIMDDICRYMGLGAALPSKGMRFLAKLGLRLKPKHFMDLIIRTSWAGDKYGLRPKGLSMKKLMDDLPNGVTLRADLPTGVIDEKMLTPDKKIDVGRAEILSELARLASDTFYRQEKFPLRLFGLRKKSTQNSWMHNVPSLARDHKEITAMIHPDDAAARRILDGDRIHIRSAHGELDVRAEVTAAVKPGNVSMPHGFGHRAGMRFAISERGVNSNILASDRAEDADRISAMSVLNGIPIQVTTLSA
jgi:anaerobic selenocysteine-containing dehydrogenase